MAELAFPYRFSGPGRTATTDHETHVRDLVEQVLLTAPGERVMRPDFGAGLLALVFEPNSVTLAAATQVLVQSALQLHLAELIAVQGVEVIDDDAALRVDVRYALLSDRSLHAAQVTVPADRP